ncbi:MAG TPA: N-acetyltransferase [Rhizomicrobium sp.]|nr:N-acetyltransferase [Rhizomicrobium sp.]
METPHSRPFTICQAYAELHPQIASVTRAAFSNRRGSGDAEEALIQALRQSGDVVVELTAMCGGSVLGHVMFSRMTTGPVAIEAAALAPLSVSPQHQRRGIGGALIERGLALCSERGTAAVFVLGDPACYRRFGFEAEATRRMVCAYAGPYLQALELRPGALGGVESVAYAPAFAAV